MQIRMTLLDPSPAEGGSGISPPHLCFGALPTIIDKSGFGLSHKWTCKPVWNNISSCSRQFIYGPRKFIPGQKRVAEKGEVPLWVK